MRAPNATRHQEVRRVRSEWGVPQRVRGEKNQDFKMGFDDVCESQAREEGSAKMT